MPSSRRTTDPKRMVLLNLSAQIEGQLREAYDQKYRAGLATQSSLARKLNINRSAIHNRLMGHTNMTVETIADMIWALDYAIKVDIYDPTMAHGANYTMGSIQSVPLSTTPSTSSGASALPPALTNLLSGGPLPIGLS